LHVPEYAGQPDAEHPTQGRLPDGKLVWQPPTQLPEALSSLASFANTDSCAAVNGVVGDVRRDATAVALGLYDLAICFALCGLATRFGASTVMLGSEEVVAVAVCDIAVPLRPHSSSAIDKIATARLEMKCDENLIAMPSQMLGQPIPSPSRHAGYQRLMRTANFKSGHQRSKQTSAHVSDTPKCNAAVQAAFGAAAAFRAGIVIAATPITTQPSPIHAVGDRLSPRNSTPSATPIGTRK
jgi:hypothetical protein